jgi:uncharacterized protein (DUF885 family)
MKAFLLSGSIVAVLVLAPSAALAAQGAPALPAASTSAEDARFLSFLDGVFDQAVAMSPESLTSLGSKKDNDRLDDYTDAGAARQQAFVEAQLARMRAEFRPETLSLQSRLSYRMFEKQVAQGRIDTKWRSHQFPITSYASPMTRVPGFLMNQHQVDSVADAQAYVARLQDVERVMREVAARVRSQASRGIVPPRYAFAPARADTRKVLSGAPFDGGAESALLADFRKKVEALSAPAETKAKLIADAKAALTGPFRRGYDIALAALDEIEPKATGNDGAWSLPDGGAYYADQLRYYTTTDLTPDQIHAFGLAEVARIHAEMEAIKAKIGFKGTLEQFFTHIKTGAGFHYPNTEEGRQAYLRDAKALIGQAMAAAPRMFHRLPKAPLEVRPVEAWRQQGGSPASYERPAPDGSRPGIFYANLGDMRQVLKPQVEAIAYHEGAPGHHFQIAMAQELEGLPKFRRFGYAGAFVEGWGLYAEKLGKELGFYQDVYADFGRLSLELWRATRLVTDSGLHAKRWSREQAIDYFKKNTLLSDSDIVREVERYIVWPGQATSYKVGEREILRLRVKAQQALGSRFDIRDFHAAVLENGALPLDLLTEQVEAYIAAKR